MDRKRTVAAASGVSLALVAASTTFAFANGVFGTRPVDRVGSYPAMMARLVPQTSPATTATTVAGAPPPKRTAKPKAASAHTLLAGDFARSNEATTAPTSLPPATSSMPTTIEPAPAPEITTTTETPTTAAPATSTPTTIAHSGPSKVTSSTESDDGSDDTVAAGSDD